MVAKVHTVEADSLLAVARMHGGLSHMEVSISANTSERTLARAVLRHIECGRLKQCLIDENVVTVNCCFDEVGLRQKCYKDSRSASRE